ncbi:hypothetical protein [Acidianus manzaensis]|uniref:Uncharacterized protein n=1 Tax=Acidianus manzaensis TaxID=282676 RepID=A0A1W6K1L1_9CREN|nr:hypothetical protein [Acidianus manzaensis]ARM76423.1 hypothetical protein B6F84_10605 [Acidianus manzaensis]
MISEKLDELDSLMKEYIEILRQMDIEKDDQKLKELYKKAVEVRAEILVIWNDIEEWLDEILDYLITFNVWP